MVVDDSLNAMMFYAFDSPPPVLYHYTSMEALLSIISTGRIRATHIRYLNDLMEAAVIWDIARRRLESKLEHTSSEPQREQLAALIQMITGRRQCTDFVASFSEDGDDLSQWRAYCPSGNGFSIGFDSAALRTQWVSDPAGGEPKWVGGKLTKVRYLSDDQPSDFERTVDDLLALAPQMEGKSTFNGPMTANGFVLAWFSVMASTFKHAAFQSENEWRLLLTKPHKPMPFQRFRPGKSSIVPFVEAVLNRDMHSTAPVPYIIKEVRVSPTPDPSLSVHALEALFLSLGHPEVDVKPSSIPFRHW